MKSNVFGICSYRLYAYRLMSLKRLIEKLQREPLKIHDVYHNLFRVASATETIILLECIAGMDRRTSRLISGVFWTVSDDNVACN